MFSFLFMLLWSKTYFSESSTDENIIVLSSTMERLMVGPKANAGKLVDKLIKLEPEILGSNMDMQVCFAILLTITSF